MRLSEAIERADMMRPNAVPLPDKKSWLLMFESEIAELLGKTEPVWSDDDDPVLLIPDNYAEIYPLQLAAQIDYYQEETDLYQLDALMANNVLYAFKAYAARRGMLGTKTRNTSITGVWI